MSTPGRYELWFDEGWCSIECIQKAAYRRSKSLTVDVRRSDGGYQCVLNASAGLGETSFLLAIEEFKKDVADEALRARLKVETEGVRNIILSAAFSRTGLHSTSGNE